MRGFLPRRLIGFIACALAAATFSLPAQTPEAFYWVNFHSPKDQSVVTWVTRALAVENWTAIREIGVEYDAALVVTTSRATPQSPPNADTFNVWSVSLTSRLVTPLLHGVNLRWLDWLRFTRNASLEPVVLYDNCRECAANTYFTAFHYDDALHRWAARWIDGGEGVPVWNSSHPSGMIWTQVYAVMTGDNGVAQLVTWNHIDLGGKRPPDDAIYSYGVDPFSGLGQTVAITGKQADAMKLQLCSAQGAVTGLARGQDSELCQNLLDSRGPRRPVTTPPAGSSGKSPSGRHVKP